MGETILIRSELLLAVARWASSEADRPYISTVYFRETEIVATDGHRLVRVPHDCKGQTFGIRRADVFAAVAAQNAWHRHHNDFAMQLDADLEAGNDGETIWTMGDRDIGIAWDGASTVSLDLLGGCVLRCPASEGTMPPVDQVMLPRREGDVPWGRGFDARYLAAVEDVVRAAGYSREGVAIEGWEDAKLTPFQFSAPLSAPEHERIRFVIMPMARNNAEGKAETERRKRQKAPR